MKYHLTAIYIKENTGYSGFCLEIPAANGQGRTLSACGKNLSAAIGLMLEEQAADLLSIIPTDYTVAPLLIDEKKISAAITYGKRMQKVAGRQRAHTLVQPAHKRKRSRAKAQ